MKYLLLIRDIKEAPLSYTHLIQWQQSSIYNKCCNTEFRNIRYYEDGEFQIIALNIFDGALIQLELEHNLQAEGLFKYYLIFDDIYLPKMATYGEWIAKILHLEYNEKFEILSKPIKE